MTDRGPLPLRVEPGSVFFHHLALWGFAVAQPLYDLLGRSPEFLVAHGVTPGGLVALALVVSLLLPGASSALVWLAWRASPVAGSLAQAGLVVVGVAAFALPPLARLEPLDGWLGVALAATLGGVALVGYWRLAALRAFATVLGLCSLLFPIGLVWRAPLGGWGSSLPGFEAPSTVSSVPVVMLVLDEFPLVSLLDRSGKIDASLFPSLARLAGEANWYRNTVAVGAFTDVAVPGILTGLTLSSGKRATSFRTQPQNLFNVLGGSHEIHASEAMTELRPPALCELRPRGVDWFVLASDLAPEAAPSTLLP